MKERGREEECDERIVNGDNRSLSATDKRVLSPPIRKIGKIQDNGERQGRDSLFYLADGH